MTFKPELVEDFLKVFNANKARIREFEGCSHLELHRDANQHNIFATYSYWDRPEDLEKYRNSPLFKEVWSQTKALFADKPEAYSHERMMLVEPDDEIRY